MTYGSNGYEEADPYYARSGFAGWLYRIFGGRGETLIGLAALLFSLTVFGFVARDYYWSGITHKSGLERITAARWNERTLAFPISGRDDAGRRASFDVVVLTKDYGWVKGSETELERGDRRLRPEDIEHEILAPQLRDGLRGARALIAVGLASQEGDLEREIQRGGLRAKRIADWIQSAVDPTIPISTLNLGQYREPCAECEDADTSWQRPFIVIAVRSVDAGTNIGEALRNAMSDKANLPSPDRYSSFALARYSR